MRVTPEKNKLLRAELEERVEARNRAERVADKRRHALFVAMEKAQRRGLTYREIAEVVGVSEARVHQVISSIRNGDE